MRDAPLAYLSEKALVWLGDAVRRTGPDDPHSHAPRICDWIALETCRELGLRRKEGVGRVPAPLSLLELSDAELIAALQFATLFTIACRQVFHNDAADEESRQAARELIAFGETLGDALRATLAVRVPEGMAN